MPRMQEASPFVSVAIYHKESNSRLKMYGSQNKMVLLTKVFNAFWLLSLLSSTLILSLIMNRFSANWSLGWNQQLLVLCRGKTQQMVHPVYQTFHLLSVIITTGSACVNGQRQAALWSMSGFRGVINLRDGSDALLLGCTIK